MLFLTVMEGELVVDIEGAKTSFSEEKVRNGSAKYFIMAAEESEIYCSSSMDFPEEYGLSMSPSELRKCLGFV